jgi:hypothetical protein
MALSASRSQCSIGHRIGGGHHDGLRISVKRWLFAAALAALPLTALAQSYNPGTGGNGSGTVTSITCGTGLSGGTITTSGTCLVPGGGITNAMLAGSIAASKLVGTDIATVGALSAGSIVSGFTTPAAGSPVMAANFSNSTIVQNSPADDGSHGCGGLHGYTFVSTNLTEQSLLVSTFTAACLPQATGSFAAPADFTVCVAGPLTLTPTTSTVNGLAAVKFGGNQCGELTASGGNWGMSQTLPQPATQTGTTFLRDDMTWVAAAQLGVAQSWTAPQRGNTETPAIATTTFTPVFSTGQNHRIDFPATTCTCTIANPAAIVAGQSGIFELVQGATSASLNPTWGSEYVYAGGTSSITLTTTLGGVDYIPYYVDSTGTYIVLGTVVLKPVH